LVNCLDPLGCKPVMGFGCSAGGGSVPPLSAELASLMEKETL
jgi:hypothetical protein